MRTLCFALSLLSIWALSGVASARSYPARGFVDLREYLAASSPTSGLPAQFDAAVGQLENEFAAACPQVFCRGRYTHVKPLSLRCSVARFNGLIQQCLWTFAGSYEQLDPASGGFQVFARVFACPLAAEGTAEQLVALLGHADTGGRLLDRPLNRYGDSVDMALRPCLAQAQ